MNYIWKELKGSSFMPFIVILRPFNKECVSLSTWEQGFICTSSEVKRFTFLLLKIMCKLRKLREKTKCGLNVLNLGLGSSWSINYETLIHQRINPSLTMCNQLERLASQDGTPVVVLQK